METFTDIKELIHNTEFDKQRMKSLKGLDYGDIDTPIIPLVKKISAIEYCFSMQSCYGHFLYKGQNKLRNIDLLPITNTISSVDYRIAYIAICIKENPEGKILLDEFAEIPLVEPEYIQFGCAEWFWERQVNSYVLQVEPKRFANKDRIFVGYEEALYIEKVRNKFFVKMNDAIEKKYY